MALGDRCIKETLLSVGHYKTAIHKSQNAQHYYSFTFSSLSSFPLANSLLSPHNSTANSTNYLNYILSFPISITNSHRNYPSNFPSIPASKIDNLAVGTRISCHYKGNLAGNS